MNEITCDELDALLPEFFDGDLAPDASAVAAQHLATCGACRIVVNDLERVGELARRHGRLELPPDAKARIRGVLGGHDGT